MVGVTPSSSSRPAPGSPTWGFLTNHALVLVYVVLHPGSTVRAIAADVAITERATLAILRDLDDDTIIERTRDGRRNTYAVNFSHLSRVRRGGVSAALTPRPFVDVVVKMLFDMARRHGTLPPEALAPQTVKEDALQPRIGSWGFFTNHMLVMLAMARGHSYTVRELAASVNITERSVLGIVHQLEDDGIISRTRDGRRNIYAIDFDAFRTFRGWSTGRWSLPPELIQVATGAIRGLARG